GSPRVRHARLSITHYDSPLLLRSRPLKLHCDSGKARALGWGEEGGVRVRCRRTRRHHRDCSRTRYGWHHSRSVPTRSRASMTTSRSSLKSCPRCPFPHNFTEQYGIASKKGDG